MRPPVRCPESDIARGPNHTRETTRTTRTAPDHDDMTETTDSHWFQPVARFLGPAYLRNAFTKGTTREVDFLVEQLGLRPGSAILDVGCGPGRHALELARRGMVVTGVDLSAEFIALARASALDAGVAERCRFECLDARDLDRDAEFDLVLSCCQGAFGLLGDDDPLVLTRMARACTPGGTVVLDTFSAYFAVRFREEHDDFDPMTGVNHEVANVRGPDGDERAFELWTTCYTPRELRLLAERVGLVVESISASAPGGWGTDPVDLERPGVMLIARRPDGPVAITSK